MRRLLIDYMEDLQKAKNSRKEAMDRFDEAKEQYGEAFRPLRTAPSGQDMDDLYNRCQPTGEYSHSDLFICIALLLYSPECLFGGKIPIKLAMLIAKTLNFRHNTIYMARKRISFWLRVYPDFQREISSIYESLPL